VVNTCLVRCLPVLSARWALSDARAGYLFTAQFSGSMLGVMGSSSSWSRRGHRISLISGPGTHGAWLGDTPRRELDAGLLATVCFGIGTWAYDTNYEPPDLRVNPEKRAAALNLINLSWGVGAVSLSVLRSGAAPHAPHFSYCSMCRCIAESCGRGHDKSFISRFLSATG